MGQRWQKRKALRGKAAAEEAVFGPINVQTEVSAAGSRNDLWLGAVAGYGAVGHASSIHTVLAKFYTAKLGQWLSAAAGDYPGTLQMRATDVGGLSGLDCGNKGALEKAYTHIYDRAGSTSGARQKVERDAKNRDFGKAILPKVITSQKWGGWASDFGGTNCPKSPG